MPLINPQRNGFGKDSYDELLIKFTSTGAPDTSSNVFTVTAVNMTYSTLTLKFPPASGLFSSSYLNVADTPFLRFNTDPFTVDFWCYFTATPADHNGFMCISSENTPNNWSLQWTTGGVGLSFWSNNTAYASTGTTNWATNTWHHVAFVFDKVNIKSYVDGLLRGTSAFAQNLSSTSGLSIGRRRRNQTSNYYTGYLDEIRLTKGLARWKSGFQVPNRQF